MLKTHKKSLGGGGKLNPKHSPLSFQETQDSHEVSKKTQSTLFRPIVATSLALALGFNIAVAQEWNTSGEATDDSTQLQWEVVGGFFAPAFQSQTDTTSINNLNFIFGKTDVTTEQWSKNTNSATITLKYDTHDFTITNNQADKGIQIGANGGGTLSVEFGQGNSSSGAGPRTFTITSKGNTGGTHFKGNIDVKSSNGSASNLNKLIITLGNGGENEWGKLDGRVSIVQGGGMDAVDTSENNLKGSPQIRFTNNTEITNGIFLKLKSAATFIFDKQAMIKNGIFAQRGLNDGKVFSFHFKGETLISSKSANTGSFENFKDAFALHAYDFTKTNITFEDIGIIQGMVYFNPDSMSILSRNAGNTIEFKKGGVIRSNKAAQSGIDFRNGEKELQGRENTAIYTNIDFYGMEDHEKLGNTITFKEKGLIQGDIITINNTKNIVNFEKDGRIEGDIFGSVAPGNKTKLYGITDINFGGDGEITGTLSSRRALGGGGESISRNTITINGEENHIKVGKLDTQGKNTITSTSSNLTLEIMNGVETNGISATTTITANGETNSITTADIANTHSAITTITTKGNHNTLTLGAFNTDGGTGTKIEVITQGTQTNSIETRTIDSKKITNIVFYNNENSSQTNTLAIEGINSETSDGQVNIYFGETQALPYSQSVSTNAFILSPQASTMATAINSAEVGNIKNTNNAKTNISMKGTTNTLQINSIETGSGDNTRTKVTINLQGTTSSTATIQDITNEKSVSLTLGNATTESATNVLNLKQVASTGGGRIADIQFGKGVNTINAIDSGLITFTSTGDSQNKIGFTADAGENAKITLTSDVLSNGDSTSNGAMFNIGASQTIELADSSGSNTLKTLTTTGSSQIHFLGESGSFRGNLTTQKGNDSDNPSGGNTKIILDSGISTANLYTTANTTAGKMTFELNGNASASQTLALGGSLTTQEGAMTDFNFNQAGVYHLTQAEGASEARIVAGGVTNFNFASGESTLSFGGNEGSPIVNPIAFEDNNHTGHFTFNLKGSDLTLLGSASDGVNRIFNVSNTTPADQSVLTSALRETIKVTNGATTTLNLLNEGDTLTLYKGVNVENGSSVVNFNANKQTLNLFGADSLTSGVATQENTLYILSTLSATNTASTQNTQNTQNPTINLVNSDMPQKDRTNFNLLMIGVDPSSGANLVGADQGYLVENATFRIFVNENKALHSSGSATLGGQKIDNSQDQASNSLGHAYSDRIIIGSIGGSATPKQATLYLFPQLENLSGFKYTHLAGNKTGTETKGNVALATIANNDQGEALVTLEAKNVFVGMEEIQVNLETAITDIGGKIILNSQDKEQLGQTYTTYFLGSVESRGASETMQEISATALSLNYDLFLANFNSLNKRMGELRNHPNDNGIWARVFGGMLTSNYKVKNDIEYITTQAGYDYGIDLNGEARNYLGLAISYATSKSSVGSLLQGTAVQNIGNSNVALSLDNVFSQGVEVALYNSYVSNVGWYSDTIFKFSYIMSEFNLKNNNFISPKAQTNNFGFVLSEEVGYRFKLGKKKEWFIDPQVELAFGYLSDNTYQTQAQAGDGLVAFTGIADAILNLRTRVGSAFGYEMQSQQTSASIYVGAFYEFDYVEGGEASTILRDSLTTPHMNVLSSSGRAVLNVGSNISLQDHTRLYFDVEKSFGDKLRTHLQFNAGVRYSFGNKNPKHNRENLSKELSSAPLKIE